MINVIGVVLAVFVILVYIHYINLYKAYEFLLRAGKRAAYDLKYNSPLTGSIVHKELDDALKYVEDCKKWI